MTDQTQKTARLSGVQAGFLASFLLGWAPILGKYAYQAAVSPMTVAAIRTVIAALILWIAYLIAWRHRISLPRKAILGCLLVGAINGVGSLFYYNGLQRLDASRAALLGAMIPVWVVIFLSASGQHIAKRTIMQLVASLIGVILVTAPWQRLSLADFLGMMLMIASAAVNGWYFVMSQWVLADVPSQNGTLYILTGMAITVTIARILTGEPFAPGAIAWQGWAAIAALGLTTALSRLAMFFSLEQLGGVQVAILSLVELVVSLGLAYIFLGDRLVWYQWLGSILLLGGGVLARAAAERTAHEPVAFNPMAGSSNR